MDWLGPGGRLLGMSALLPRDVPSWDKRAPIGGLGVHEIVWYLRAIDGNGGSRAFMPGRLVSLLVRDEDASLMWSGGG
jgi:hypothetical protein